MSSSNVGAAGIGISVLAGFLIGATGLWWMQRDSEPPVKKEVDPRTQKYPRPDISETGPYPQVKAEEREYFFGTMELGKTDEHTFLVANAGEAELVLMPGPKSCDCTRYEIEKRHVPPGESSKVTIEWKPSHSDNIFRQMVNLYTNDPKDPVVQLTISGSVAALVQMLPKGDWDLGNVDSPDGGSIDGLVASGLLDSVDLVDIEKSHPAISMELVKARDVDLKDLRATGGTEVHVRLGKTIPPGPFRGTISFGLEARPGQRFTINLKAHRDGAIRFEGNDSARWLKRRQLLDLGEFLASKGKTGNVWLYVRGDHQTITPTAIETQPSFLKCTLTKDPGFRSPTTTRYSLALEVPPGSPAGAYSSADPARVQIRTDHPDYPEMNLTVHFIALKDAAAEK